MPPQVVVCTRDLPALIERSRTMAQRRHGADTGGASKPAAARPNVKTAYVAPRNELEQNVAEIWQTVIGVQQVGIHDNFIELGGHSLLAIQVMARMRDAYQVDLPVELLFKAPTVAVLAEAILEKLAEQADGDALDKMVAELEQVSEEDAQAMLAAERA